MAGRLKLARPGHKRVLYYVDDELWAWTEYHWYNPFHWFKKKKR